MNKKRIFIIGLAVCLVALLGVGTLAYFTDSEEVTNTFKTTDSDDDTPDDIFSVEVSETAPDGTTTTTGNTYEQVVPGASFDKDPTVTNTGKYDQWIRVIVTMDKAAAWRDVFNNEDTELADLGIFANCGSGKPWTWAEGESSGYNAADTQDVITLVFYLNEKLEPGDSEVLFSKVYIPTSITTEQMTALNGFTIKVSAQAIQADYNGDTAQEGFQNWPTEP